MRECHTPHLLASVHENKMCQVNLQVNKTVKTHVHRVPFVKNQNKAADAFLLKCYICTVYNNNELI